MHRNLIAAFAARDIDAVRECYRMHGADVVVALRDLFAEDGDGLLMMVQMVPCNAAVPSDGDRERRSSATENGETVDTGNSRERWRKP